MPPDLLKVAALARGFAGGTGISHVSFSVPPGSVTAFIGVNGAGKSTTLRCVMGLLRPDAGEILLIPAALLHKPGDLGTQAGCGIAVHAAIVKLAPAPAKVRCG